MDKIQQHNIINELISKVKISGKKFYTNFFLDKNSCDKGIERGNLFFKEYENSIFVFKKYRDYYYLYFISNNLESLSTDLNDLVKTHINVKFIIDVIGRGVDVEKYVHLFCQSEFTSYEILRRMSRKTEEEKKIDSNVTYATIEDVSIITEYFEKNFDELSEHIPTFDEIVEWTDKKNVIKYVYDNQIAGFVIFELIGVTSYLRYWFVSQEFRDMRIGSKLLRAYFYYSNNTKRQLFWVIEKNENAIKRYMHYGFTFENLYNFVFVK